MPAGWRRALRRVSRGWSIRPTSTSTSGADLGVGSGQLSRSRSCSPRATASSSSKTAPHWQMRQLQSLRAGQAAVCSAGHLQTGEQAVRRTVAGRVCLHDRRDRGQTGGSRRSSLLALAASTTTTAFTPGCSARTGDSISTAETKGWGWCRRAQPVVDILGGEVGENANDLSRQAKAAQASLGRGRVRIQLQSRWLGFRDLRLQLPQQLRALRRFLRHRSGNPTTTTTAIKALDQLRDGRRKLWLHRAEGIQLGPRQGHLPRPNQTGSTLASTLAGRGAERAPHRRRVLRAGFAFMRGACSPRSFSARCFTPMPG